MTFILNIFKSFKFIGPMAVSLFNICKMIFSNKKGAPTPAKKSLPKIKLAVQQANVDAFKLSSIEKNVEKYNKILSLIHKNDYTEILILVGCYGDDVVNFILSSSELIPEYKALLLLLRMKHV